MATVTSDEEVSENKSDRLENRQNVRKRVEKVMSRSSSVTKSEQRTGNKKANEQSEGDNGIIPNVADAATDIYHKDSGTILLRMRASKDKKFYIVSGIIWVLSLFTRLYDISQPAKIW